MGCSMHKKLDDATLEKIIEAGIEEFAENGLEKTAMSGIAKRAGVSVGVIYKYYEDKDSFFLACVDYSLELLQQVMENVIRNEDDLKNCIERIVSDLIEAAAEHRSYYRMYHEITTGSCARFASKLASRIEGMSAKVYAGLMDKAEKDGMVRISGDPRILAFFFDNLLMMLQFSLTCDYYSERMKVYCGAENCDNPEAVGKAMVGFIYGALGI